MVAVGIPTVGRPQLEKQGEGWLLRNMMIGKGFHWQRQVEALLPGEVVIRWGNNEEKPGEVKVSGEEEYGVLNRLPLETYLECVVGSEMSPSAPEEFLKAHAVISRSWALGKILGAHDHSPTGKVDTDTCLIDWEDTSDHVGFDLCSDDHCQRYQGIQPLPPAIQKALRDTRGQILTTVEGKLVDARFSKCCGGLTEVFSTCWQEREEPCLVSFADPWCDLSDLSEEDQENLLSSVLKSYDQETGDGYKWEVEVTAEEVKNNLKTKFGRNIGDITNLKVLEAGPSGRAKRLLLTGTQGSLELGKELAIRKLLSPTHLYSSRFTMEPLAGGWRLKGRGWGHGVGLCQIGAARMAHEGHDYRSILSFYYPGSVLSDTFTGK